MLEKLGSGALEKAVRLLLLLSIFLLPFSLPLILDESRSLIADINNSFAVPKLYPVEFVMATAAIGWIWLRRPTGQALRPYRWLAVVATVAAISGQWASYGFLAFISSIHIVVAGAWLVMLAHEFRDSTFAKAAAWCFIGTVSLQAAWGISQYLIGSDLGLRWLGESQLGTAIQGVAKVAGETIHLRGYGSLPHPNVLAAYLVTAIFFIGTLVFWPYRAKERWRALLYPAVLLLLGSALILTFSRVAISITVINGLLIILFSYRRWHRLPVTAGLAAAGLLVVSLLLWPQVKARTTVESPTETGVSNRVVGYQLAGSMISDRPLGVGAGNFVIAAPELKSDLPAYQYQPVHNSLLLIAAELGAIPATLVLAWLVRLGWAFHFLKVRGRRANTLNFSLFCAAGAFIAMGMTDHFFWSLPQGLWLAVLLAAAVISRIPRPEWQRQ